MRFRANFKSNIGNLLNKVYKRNSVWINVVKKYAKKVAGDSRYLQAI